MIDIFIECIPHSKSSANTFGSLCLKLTKTDYVINFCQSYRGIGQLQHHSSFPPPHFPPKMRFYIPLEVYAYVISACLFLLATSLQKNIDFFFHFLFLHKMAATFEFGTIHHGGKNHKPLFNLSLIIISLCSF